MSIGIPAIRPGRSVQACFSRELDNPRPGL